MAAIQPIVLSFITSKAFKKFVLRILKAYVKTTDNIMDDELVELIRITLFTADL